MVTLRTPSIEFRPPNSNRNDDGKRGGGFRGRRGCCFAGDTGAQRELDPPGRTACRRKTQSIMKIGEFRRFPFSFPSN